MTDFLEKMIFSVMSGEVSEDVVEARSRRSRQRLSRKVATKADVSSSSPSGKYHVILSNKVQRKIDNWARETEKKSRRLSRL